MDLFIFYGRFIAGEEKPTNKHADTHSERAFRASFPEVHVHKVTAISFQSVIYESNLCYNVCMKTAPGT